MVYSKNWHFCVFSQSLQPAAGGYSQLFAVSFQRPTEAGERFLGISGVAGDDNQCPVVNESWQVVIAVDEDNRFAQ